MICDSCQEDSFDVSQVTPPTTVLSLNASLAVIPFYVILLLSSVAKEQGLIQAWCVCKIVLLSPVKQADYPNVEENRLHEYSGGV